MRHGLPAPLALLALACLLAVGLACGSLSVTPTALPTATLVPSPDPTPTITPDPPDTGWQTSQPGIEIRRLRVQIGDYIERPIIVRVDPAAVYFRVHYDPSSLRPVSAWADQLGGLLVINGGYFSEEGATTALLVSNGQRWGSSYGDFAGQFTVSLADQVDVRWLAAHPYDPEEPVKEALQSFPVLVKPGGVMGFPADADAGQPSRRSVVAQDVEGRILFIVAPNGYFSLHTLARFLAESGLGIDVALNLDGGTSAGMWVITGNGPLVADSLAPVPSVISVQPR